MEYTNDSSNNMEFQDERIRRLQQNVQELRQSAEVGVKYMQLWEELLEKKAEGKAEGKAEDIISFLEELGVVPISLKERILEQQDLKRLGAWLKIAARADSIDDFARAIEE